MKTLASLLCLVALVSSGCTVSRVLHGDDADFAASLNRKGKRHKAVLTTLAGRRLEARELRMYGDSLSFMSPLQQPHGVSGSPTVRSIGASEVVKVEFVHHGTGATNGLGLGFLTGFAGGFIFGATVLATEKDITGDPQVVGFFSGVAFGVSSALIGTIVGAIIGKRYRYNFTARPPHRPVSPWDL